MRERMNGGRREIQKRVQKCARGHTFSREREHGARVHQQLNAMMVLQSSSIANCRGGSAPVPSSGELKKKKRKRRVHNNEHTPS